LSEALVAGYALALMPEPPDTRNLLLILAKDLSSRLATPVVVVDHEGNLLYFNEAAEPVLGVPWAEVGFMPADKWPMLFQPRGERGHPLTIEELPLTFTITEHKPTHRTVTITGADGEVRRLAVTAIPLFAHTGEFVGAVALFWEAEDS
jgi:PAS domain-containing protein